MLVLTIWLSLLTCLAWSKPVDDSPTVGIVGGWEVSNGGAPYIVSLQTMQGVHFCAGSIISDEWILTAAHCVFGFYPTDFTVRYNFLHLSNPKVTRVEVDKIYPLPGYHWSSNEHDLALIHTKSRMKLGQVNAKAVRLPPMDFDPLPGTSLRVSGWGGVHDGQREPTDHLRQVMVEVVDRYDCRKLYRNTIYKITEDMVCAGDLILGGRDACQMDSGGPALSGRYLAGVVSWGDGCGRRDYPGVYTRVGSYRDWIRDITGL